MIDDWRLQAPLMYIAEFQNRLLVLVQWVRNYATFNRSARLIIGESPLPLDL
jgi:NADH:quinone reductase (non-electrogenic)